jgi:Chlorophyll A-B binding protein
MKTAIIASLIATAAAFAPAKQASFGTALNAKAAPKAAPKAKVVPKAKAAPKAKAVAAPSKGSIFEAELGAQPPLGFFDPLGITAKGDVNDFERLRYVEIKHGRICMLAVVGYLVTYAGIRLPGDLTLDGTSFADIPAGFAGVGALPESGLIQLVGFIGFLELFVMKDIAGTGNEHIGDFRNGALDYGWDTLDDATKLKKRAIELNQGRAAQMGILALMVHEKLGVSLIPSL